MLLCINKLYKLSYINKIIKLIVICIIEKLFVSLSYKQNTKTIKIMNEIEIDGKVYDVMLNVAFIQQHIIINGVTTDIGIRANCTP